MSAKPKFEQTEVGIQTLIDGVRPITLSETLTARTCHPMTPKRNPNAQQKPCDIGMFDEVGRAQIDLIDFINSTPSPKTQTAK
ncbi:MAG: hypothetical protein COB36_13265 [Alphaproteobacteria bacterium]|nr:MAG: hypothetical protein COB36_13265 [Alphaproteobacteria bacterium]